MIDIDTGAGWEPEFSQGMGSTPINLTPYNTQTNKKKNPRNTNFGSAIKKGKSLPPPPHTHTHSRGPLHPQLFIEALLEVIGYVSLHPICLTAKIFCTPSLETKYFVSEPSIICLHFCSIYVHVLITDFRILKKIIIILFSLDTTKDTRMLIFMIRKHVKIPR